MWPKLKSLILIRLRLKESWVIFFVMGIIMMNYPFISIFNKSAHILHIPLLYLYLQLGWFVSIFVIFLFTKADLPNNHDNHKGEPR